MEDVEKKLSLSDDQKKFLAECEEQFNNRYTDDDEEYVKYKDFERIKPPIVDPWFSKPPFNSSRRNYGQGRRNQNWDRRYNDRPDRHAGKHQLYNHRNSRPY